MLIALGTGSCTKLELLAHNNMARNNLDETTNPCWFLSSAGFDGVSRVTIEHRQNREREGYPSDTALAEALKIFNEEQACINPDAKKTPSLTEDELLSAIAVGPDYGREDAWSTQSVVFGRILKTKKLPKGALLVSDGPGTFTSPLGGPPGQDWKVNGHRIYLFLNLDSNARESAPLRDDQIFLIKKTLIGLRGLD